MRHHLVLLLAVVCSGSAWTVELPADDAYVQVRDGHLALGGERLRLWGAIGSFPGKAETRAGDLYFRQKAIIARLQQVGFNTVRVWHLAFDGAATVGDGSATDISDFFVAECGRQGIKLWGAGFGGGRLYRDEVPAAAKVIDDSATEAEWVAAIQSLCKKEYWTGDRTAMQLLIPAVAWDPRLEALAIQQMRAKAMHVNLHNGLRFADDPTFAVWELTNEQWWMRKMMGGQWLKLPDFLRRSLITRWNAWLLAKYGTQAALQSAWGFTFPGEDLAGGTVLFAPMGQAMKPLALNDTNPAALAAFSSVDTVVGRNEVTAQRISDVLAFLMETLISHKQRMAAAVKSWGKSTRLSPLIYDTGIGESIQSQYLHQQADAVVHGGYMEGDELAALDPQSRRWPWYSGLDAPPQLSKDVPWMEHNRFPGKPFLVYETQYGSPSKYRAEWPARIVAAGSLQDWDGVNFHYWSADGYDLDEATPFSGGRLPSPGPGAFQYDYTTDEVEQAEMRVMGAVFRHVLVQPAPSPTVFRFGRPALYDPKSMDYAGAYGRTGLMDMMTTAYTRGMRLIIDPTQAEFLKTEGPVTRFNGFERSSLIKPTAEIEFDVQRSHLVMDAPGVASYTGFLGQHGSPDLRFANGVALTGIVHRDPPGTPYPAGDERFTAFTLASEDGRPLASCTKAVIALVSSSCNTGLKVDRGQRKITDYGSAPILVTRVGGTLTAPALAGMQWRMIDFDGHDLAHGTIAADGVLEIPSNRPVWLTELHR